jgi:hypothetical protein
MTMIEPNNFHRLRAGVKVLSAVIGASVVVAMGAVTVAYPRNDVGAIAQQAPTAGPRQQLLRRRRRHPRRPSPPRQSPPPHVQKG